jgi:hypothetical protein
MQHLKCRFALALIVPPLTPRDLDALNHSRVFRLGEAWADQGNPLVSEAFKLFQQGLPQG